MKSRLPPVLIRSSAPLVGGPELQAGIQVEILPIRGADGYNLVAPLDKTLSKRNDYFRLSEFNVQPASLSLSMRYRF